ncbi:hypothetical protein XENOCAPTIV_017102 [Xenoophorus captivus]|uniref:Uncharacterized protein n=1 Tax=Xenoophorus captivus TaxID=1517983 RepID=A0ABV0R0T3_9TELE
MERRAAFNDGNLEVVGQKKNELRTILKRTKMKYEEKVESVIVVVIDLSHIQKNTLNDNWLDEPKTYPLKSRLKREKKLTSKLRYSNLRQQPKYEILWKTR